jgi:nucleotide-binding universal stress UspA family protein
MYKTIVVGYDGSETSAAALKEASLLVKSNGGRLIIMHAVYFDKEEFAILPSQLEQRFEDGAGLCRAAKAGAQAELGMDGAVASLVCEGEPPQLLLETAENNRADLIALGTYGRKGFKRLLMGSVTSQVILNAGCDVLVVKKPCSERRGSYHSLLVPFDNSASSRKALVRALELAKSGNGEVTVLYVIPRYEELMDFIKTESIGKSLHHEADKIVSEARKLAVDNGAQLSTVVKEGRSADIITETADKLKSDLIVMGTHGWRGMEKALMGSTAERVIAQASCPVLIAK